MATKPTDKSPRTSVNAQDASREALKLLMQAKIACSNSIQDLETLDGLTDDWPESDNLTNAALDLHLHCEASIKECQAIIDTLDTFATAPSGTSFTQQFVEIVRPKRPQLNS